MIKLNKYAVGVAMVLLVALVLAATIWNIDSDTKHEKFKTYYELEQSELIKKGWVPDFIPRTSRNIEVAYNIDTNVVRITFHLPNSESNVLLNQLKANGWQIANVNQSIEAENNDYVVRLEQQGAFVSIRSKYKQ